MVWVSEIRIRGSKKGTGSGFSDLDAQHCNFPISTVVELTMGYVYQLRGHLSVLFFYIFLGHSGTLSYQAALVPASLKFISKPAASLFTIWILNL
jgi:hypothetical protein